MTLVHYERQEKNANTNDPPWFHSPGRQVVAAGGIEVPLRYCWLTWYPWVNSGAGLATPAKRVGSSELKALCWGKMLEDPEAWIWRNQNSVHFGTLSASKQGYFSHYYLAL